MEANQGFSGGLHQDSDYQFQPENTYPFAENWLLTPGGQLLQEKGATAIASSGLPVVGITTLGDEEIFFSTNGLLSEIGTGSGTSYTPILQSPLFDLHYPVRATARLDYRGHRIVYWGDNYSFRFLDLDEPTTNLPAGLAVLPTPNSPLIEVAAVNGDGSLPTGVYQATASLVTASKNEASYGLFTGIIPILNEDPNTSSRQQLDGAPPQTAASGSITFSLNNLDPSYSYVKLVVATYTGISNTLELHSLPLIPINGQTNLTTTYYSFSQHQDNLTLAQVLGEVPNYAAAGEVTQKDGHLLAANVKVAPEENINWQAIANSIVLGPTIKEVAFSEAVHITHYQEDSTIGGIDDAPLSFSKEDYKNPLLTTKFKGFTRDEVYSFSFTPIVNGRKLDTYHIPASTNPDAFAAYTSLEAYPLNQGYPAGNVTHHRMPSLLQEPLLSATGIRILGVQEISKPDISLLTPSQQGSFTGYLIGMQTRDEANRSILAQGIINPLVAARDNYCLYVSPFTGHPDFDGPNSASHTDGRMSKEYAAFYSPETSILQNSINAATKLTQVGTLTGTTYDVADKRTGGLGQEFAAIFFNYTANTPTASPPIPLLPPSTSYIQGMNGTAPATLQSGERYPIMVSGQNGFALLKADISNSSGIPYQTGTPDVSFTYEDGDVTSSLRFRQADGSTPNQDDANFMGVTTRPLYNLIATRTRQYGAVSSATYFPIATSTTTSPPLTIFNGDTFIGKVALLSVTQENTDEESGIGYSSMSYFHCESTVNVNYRHYVAANSTTGTVPYYPKSRNLWQKDGSGVMQYPTVLGQANGYNRQYSFTNTLTPLIPKDYSLTPVTSFEDRIIYSVQAIEGEQLDAYRVFRANDYHDIPKNYGPITSLAQPNSQLYIHTTDALWKSSFNERVTQESSIGEVVLGNGGLFPRPSTPVLTIDGGYAGSQHALAAITTPIGHFFTDAKRGKVFILTDTLSEISKVGLTKYFRDSLKEGSDYHAYYDYIYERYVLLGTGFPTISFSAYNKKWVSLHSTFAHFSYGTALRSLLETGGTVSLPNTGITQQASIQLIANLSPSESKLFAGSTIHASNPPSQLAQYTSQQASGGLQVNPYTTYGQDPAPNEVLYRFLSDQYQVSSVRDLEGGRLSGKWLRSFWTWATSPLPTTLRLITTAIQQRSRS